ncbi:MAG: chemotaxis protein CheD [Bryobacter sp.]|nr:chemotaxis protein CheD [Bryobacter sp.]
MWRRRSTRGPLRGEAALEEPRVKRRAGSKMGEIHRVRMGEIACGESGVLHTILGSCVGIALWRKDGGPVGLAHCVLPEPMGEMENKGARFVSTGVPNLLRALGWRQGESLRGWRGVVAGGAKSLEGAQANWEVGRLNLEAARKALDELGIRYELMPATGHRGCVLEVDCVSRRYRAEALEANEGEGARRKQNRGTTGK